MTNILKYNELRVLSIARIVCEAGSVTVGCPSVCPVIRPQQRRTAGLLLSAMRAKGIAQQQRSSSTALSSKCGQCHVDSQVDEAEHRLVL